MYISKPDRFLIHATIIFLALLALGLMVVAILEGELRHAAILFPTAVIGSYLAYDVFVNEM